MIQVEKVRWKAQDSVEVRAGEDDVRLPCHQIASVSTVRMSISGGGGRPGGWREKNSTFSTVKGTDRNTGHSVECVV